MSRLTIATDVELRDYEAQLHACVGLDDEAAHSRFLRRMGELLHTGHVTLTTHLEPVRQRWVESGVRRGATCSRCAQAITGRAWVLAGVWSWLCQRCYDGGAR